MTRTAEFPFVIKICGITNEEDARAAVDAGANALGFNFYPKSPRYITAVRARAIVEAVPGEYAKVGIFVNPTVEEVITAYEAAILNVVQLHGGRCPVLSALDVWKAISADENQPSYTHASAYLLDAPSDLFGGSGQVFDWKLAAGRKHRVLIAGGLDASNVAEAIAAALPWGVDACSRLESRPGKKDAVKVTEFVRAARSSIRLYKQQEISL